MCSGGDLDGDDYLVIWDEDLIPEEWNHPPMNYTGPEPVKSEGPVTVNDMTDFFVKHMQYDNLPMIAVAHKHWADAKLDGLKDDVCLKLAELHSTAVDFVKTGVPAKMPKELHPKCLPHWAEKKNKPMYISKKVLGQLYDEVKPELFCPAWDMPFDQRILEAFNLDQQTLEDAREVKQQYDQGVRRIMAKFQIKRELEVWTTFVLEHSDDVGDYKFSEAIGEATMALKDAHRILCYEKAGTNEMERDWSKLGPFIAAMYTVTAEEVVAALAECNETTLVHGQGVPVRQCTIESMPFMSFPWIFPAELGRIANKRDGLLMHMTQKLAMPKSERIKQRQIDLLGDDFELEDLPEAAHPTSGINGGELLDLIQQDTALDGPSLPNIDSGEEKQVEEGTVPAASPHNSPPDGESSENTEYSPCMATPNGTDTEGVTECSRPSGALAIDVDVSTTPVNIHHERLACCTSSAVPTNLSRAVWETETEANDALPNSGASGGQAVKSPPEDSFVDEEAGEEAITLDFQPPALTALGDLCAS